VNNKVRFFMLFPQELERFSQNSFSHTAAAAAARSTAHMNAAAGKHENKSEKCRE
jgi:hypothetical protein